MRCPDCNKFVSYDEQEPEVNLDLNDGEVNGDVRVVLPCAECGTELKECTFDVSEDVSGELEDHNREKHPEKVNKDSDGEEESVDVDNFDLSDDGSEFTTRMKGKGRWTETFYGHITNYSITCDICGEQVVSRTVQDDCKASGMDELV